MDKLVGKRDIKLSDYSISKAKYNELRYFCMQYEEKKREIQSLNITVSNKRKTSKDISMEILEKIGRLQKDITLIDQTALDADADIYQFIIKSVSESIVYEYMDIPLSRTKFYDSRRYFFYLLAQKR